MNETNKFNSFLQLSLYDELKPEIIIPQETDFEQWSAMAYAFLLNYIKSHDTFTIENVRLASEGIIPVPKELRSWGAIALVAKRSGLIERTDYEESNNTKAHNALVSFWKVIKS